MNKEKQKKDIKSKKIYVQCGGAWFILEEDKVSKRKKFIGIL